MTLLAMYLVWTILKCEHNFDTIICHTYSDFESKTGFVWFFPKSVIFIIFVRFDLLNWIVQ